jgi:hypothetical protein
MSGCWICGGEVSLDDDDTVVSVTLPHGLSDEVLREAVERAMAAGGPDTEDERARYVILAYLRSGRPDATAGRALDALGARLVSAHPDCAEGSGMAPPAEHDASCGG